MLPEDVGGGLWQEDVGWGLWREDVDVGLSREELHWNWWGCDDVSREDPLMSHD